MRPEALEEARDWLMRAERDLMAAARVMEGSQPLTDHAAFHSQQAAEKALKAYLAAQDSPFPKTHDLGRLLAQCGALDPEFSRFQTAAQILNPYSVQFRYPGGPLEPGADEADEALRLAREVVQFVRDRLSPAETG